MLEDTLEILDTKQRDAVRTARASDPGGATKTTTIFETEDVEQLSNIPEFRQSAQAEAAAGYKLESSETDVSFALYCFFMDLTRIRLLVRRTWRAFKHGETGLLDASLTMNVAISFIEKLSNEFKEALPRFQQSETQYMHVKILTFIYNGHCSQDEGPPLSTIEEDTADPFAYDEDGQTLRSATVLCTHTFDLLWERFVSRSTNLRLSFDERRFLRSVSQIAALPANKLQNENRTLEERVYQGGMIHKAVHNLLRGSQADSWIIVAIQILWDTQRELGSMLSVPKHLLECVSHDLVQDCKRFLDPVGLLDGVKALSEYRGVIKDLLVSVEATAVKPNQRSLLNELLLGPSLLQSHPSSCGLNLLNIWDKYHRTFIDIANCEGQILVAAHLHHAAHHLGLLPETIRWADRDFFMEHQSLEKLFAGNKPEKGYEFAERLKVVLGRSAATNAREPTRSKNVKNHKTDTGIGDSSPLEYLARYSQWGSRQLANTKKPPSVESCGGKDVMAMAETLARGFLETDDKSTTVSILGTLRGFKKAVETDERALSFDVMQLHLQCLALLRSIQIHCLNHAPKDFALPAFKGKLGMKAVVVQISDHWSGTAHRHNIMLPDAVDILRKVIMKEGRMVIDKLEVQQEKMKSRQTSAPEEVESSFENQDEECLPLKLRDLFGDIIFQDANGDWRMPFGSR